MIVMTPAQADAVRGVTTPGHSLEPVLLADGQTWVLPEDVKADPNHVSKLALLSSYPTRAVSSDEFVQ